MKTSLWFAIALLNVLVAVHADVIVLKNGLVYPGKLQASTSTSVTFERSGFKIPYPIGAIRDLYIDSNAVPTFAPLLERPTVGGAHELPDWGQVITHLAKESWATEIRQIPATVIDKSVFRNVPYTSFRCGSGMYEVNVYGDPQRLAAFEIGACKSYAGQDFAHRNCLAFIRGLFTDDTLKRALDSLAASEGKVETNTVTIEITPPTGEDAYGSWWVSVYIEPMLDAARASDAEMNAVSIVAKPAARPVSASEETPWSSDDLRYARPLSTETAGQSSGGRVYVRSYYRKDGTYVTGHYRSRGR